MHKYISRGKIVYFAIFLFLFSLGINSAISAPSQSLANRLKGYILLQVEENGEAWYVIPTEQKMVYLQNGAVAYQVMRELSLGITDANLAKIPVGIEARFNDLDTDGDGLADRLEEGLGTDLKKADTDNDGFSDGEEIKNNFSPINANKLVYDQTLVNRLRGYILLQVEKQGQAWYLNPSDGKRYYMQDGPAAYNIMRFLSLGITNKDLNLIPKSERTFDVNTTPPGNGDTNTQGNNNSTSTPPTTPPGNNGGGNSGGGGGGGSTRPPTPNNDQDNDGYVSSSMGGNDCNDSNPSIHPGTTDTCGNDVDEDCSGSDLQCVVSDYDEDNDGYDSTQYGGTDCNDNNANVNPGEAEISRNNIDDNCNGQTDEIVIVPGADTQEPSTPTNLAGTTSGAQVILTWNQSTDNIGVYQYDVERQISVITGYQNIASVNATTYTNIDLEPSGTYTYRVKARDLAGNSSGYSNIFTITTNAEADIIPPSTPTNLAAAVSGTQISLTWSNSTDNVGVVQYYIERSADNSIFSEIDTSVTNSYVDSGLNYSTTYYYRVRARDAASYYSGFSNVVNAVTPSAPDTTAPTIPSALSATISGTQASLSWTASTDNVGVVGYQIWRSTTNGGPYNTQVATSNTNSYTHTLAAGTYYYIVKAYDAAGFVSGNSNQVIVQISGGDTSCAPITLTNLAANIGINNPQNTASVAVTSGDVMYLTIGMSFNSGYPDDSITISGLGATWTKVSTNTFGYRRRGWLFRGVGGAGSGPVTINYTGTGTPQELGWSLDGASGLNLTTPNDSIASTNTGFTSPQFLTVSTSNTPGTCDVTYSSMQLEDQKATNVEAGWSSLGQTSSGSLGVRKVASAWDDARDTSHTWNWTGGSDALAFITILKSSSSSVVPPTGDQTAPTTPSNLIVSASGTQISLSWTASTDNVGVSQYLVERSTSASSGFVQIATPTTNSYADSGLANSTTYYYRIRAQDTSGNISSSYASANATTGTSTTPPSGSVSITGVSGTMSHGQTVTISGSGFGTKSIVAPIAYDTMESGDFSTAWNSHNHLVIGSNSANKRHINSNYYGTHNFQGNLYQSAGFFTGPNSQVRDTWYGRYWFKLDNNLDWGTTGETAGDGNLANVKIFRLFSPADINEDFVVATEGFSGGGIIYKDENTVDPLHYADTNISEWTKNTWHVFDFAFKEGSLGGTNGIFKMWFNGKLVADVNTLMTRQDFDLLKRPLILGFYNSWFDSNSDRDDFYIDDAYIDGTWSRVMLCNQATWNDSISRHCEIQAPQSTWNSNSIQISFNQGSFTSGQTVYLYVIDSNGNVNTSGYPIQIASVLGSNAQSCNAPDQDTLNWSSLSQNILVRGCSSAIYVITNGQRLQIPNLEILRRDYPGQRVYNISEALLASYPIRYW